MVFNPVSCRTMSYYRYHLFFCVNQRENGRACCANHDAQAMRDYMKARVKELGLAGRGKIRVNNAGCLDRCALGPTLVVYPEQVWYSYSSKQDLDDILEQHLKNGQIVQRLLLDKPES